MKTKTAYIIAGPNGSGKTTFAKELMMELCLPFINADEIAFALSPKDFKKVRVKAGKIFFEQIASCLGQNESFIVETTLSGKYWIDWLEKLKEHHYTVVMIFIFLEDVQEAVKRIDIRVSKGGHPVSREDIQRRFDRSKKNFWHLYRAKADYWEIFLNSKDEFLKVALGAGPELSIFDERNFQLFMEGLK